MASRAPTQQSTSKGDELVSKLTNYLEERSLSSSSSSSGLNTAFFLMTSQNNELRSQNTELRNQVDRYRVEVDRLERKLEKSRKKAEMTDLVAQLASHSISPQFSSTLERTSTPIGDFFPQTTAPAIGEGDIQGVVRFCPDGSEVWYPGSEMPGDFQLNALNSSWSPLDNHPSSF